MPLRSRVLKTQEVNWREFKFIQKDNFKNIDPEAVHKLKASIVSNQFVEPFYVWEDETNEDIYCLDGKHRTMMLEQLISEGIEVPYTLPATFMHCENKKEAAKLVTIYSSVYAKVDQKGFFEFLQDYDLNFMDLKDQIDLPEFSNDRFIQKFDILGVNETQGDDDVPEDIPEEEIIVKTGDIFKLGRHILICADFKDRERLNPYLENKKARIVLTDPPYNVKADDIGNSGKTQHKDFAMAAGEMSDDQFVDFLSGIMQSSCDYSLPGAIHFIFMDWRHVWHITEASKRIYGSPIPKQVCMWNKDVMAMGSFYRSKHELVFVFKHGKEKHLSHIDLIDRIRTNVWDYPSGHSMNNPDRDQMENHPTPKPVGMLCDAVLDTTDEDDVVVDFFLGSGSTLIACEKTNRICIGTEIEKMHTQNIINRYLSFCNKNGLIPTFEHVNGSLTINDFIHAQNT